MISQELLNAQKLLAQYRKRDGVDIPVSFPAPEMVQICPPADPAPRPNFPPHAPRPTAPPLWYASGAAAAPIPAAADRPTAPPPGLRPLPTAVRHYPSIGIAALESGAEAAYRVWLSCRALDSDGRGWLPLDVVRKSLSRRGELPIAGCRQLRNLLRAGQGIFWTRDRDRVWLRGAAAVAAALGVERLAGRPVALPVDVLAAGMGEFRAHLYAAWHSGRRQSGRPISRGKQSELLAIPERTQRHYCVVAGIERTNNYATGDRISAENAENAAWAHGTGYFEFKDWNGRQGRKNAAYAAWQLPASHSAVHETACVGRQRKINRKLKDLVSYGAQGNGGGMVNQLFFDDGAGAARAHNRNAGDDHFWRSMRRNGRYSLWHVIPATSMI